MEKSDEYYKNNCRRFLRNYLSDDCPKDIDAYARKTYAEADPETRDLGKTDFDFAIMKLGRPS